MELLPRGSPVFTLFVDAGLNLRLQGRHAHHEKLIEIVAENGAEFGLFQQLCSLVERLS